MINIHCFCFHSLRRIFHNIQKCQIIGLSCIPKKSLLNALLCEWRSFGSTLDVSTDWYVIKFKINLFRINTTFKLARLEFWPNVKVILPKYLMLCIYKISIISGVVMTELNCARSFTVANYEDLSRSITIVIFLVHDILVSCIFVVNVWLSWWIRPYMPYPLPF